MAVRFQFVEAGELRMMKALERRAIEREAQQKQNRRRRPRQPVCVELSESEWPHRTKGHSDKSAPDGHEKRETAAASRAPVGDPKIHHQPEERDRAIDGA